MPTPVLAPPGVPCAPQSRGSVSAAGGPGLEVGGAGRAGAGLSSAPNFEAVPSHLRATDASLRKYREWRLAGEGTILSRYTLAASEMRSGSAPARPSSPRLPSSGRTREAPRQLRHPRLLGHPVNTRPPPAISRAPAVHSCVAGPILSPCSSPTTSASPVPS